jgi:hypothetical protein
MTSPPTLADLMADPGELDVSARTNEIQARQAARGAAREAAAPSITDHKRTRADE